VKRFFRWVFSGLAMLSLACLLVVVIIWIRSDSVADSISSLNSTATNGVVVVSSSGSVAIYGVWGNKRLWEPWQGGVNLETGWPREDLQAQMQRIPHISFAGFGAGRLVQPRPPWVSYGGLVEIIFPLWCLALILALPCWVFFAAVFGRKTAAAGARERQA
jgi:hypothetical protein